MAAVDSEGTRQSPGMFTFYLKCFLSEKARGILLTRHEKNLTLSNHKKRGGRFPSKNFKYLLYIPYLSENRLKK